MGQGDTSEEDSKSDESDLTDASFDAHVNKKESLSRQKKGGKGDTSLINTKESPGRPQENDSGSESGSERTESEEESDRSENDESRSSGSEGRAQTLGAETEKSYKVPLRSKDSLKYHKENSMLTMDIESGTGEVNR